MLKSRLKKRDVFGLCGALLGVSLALLPAAANAATINSVLAAGAGTTVTDAGRNGLTSFGVNFADTEGLWLLMDPSSTANEDFTIQMSNYSGNPITDLWFEARKLQGDFGYRPVNTDWENSIKVVNGGTGGTIAPGELVNGVDFQRFHMVLNTPVSLAAGSALSLSLTTDSPGHALSDWLNFNVPQERWLLNIDWNGVDDNLPLPAVPVPAAVWLFGSGLAGLLAFSRRRRDR